MSLGAQACVLVLAALLAPAKGDLYPAGEPVLFIRPENLGAGRSRAYKGLVCGGPGGWVLANGATVAYMFRSVDVERLTLALAPLAVLAALAAMAWLRWRKSPAFRRGAVIGGAVLAAVLAAVALWVAGNSGETLTPEEYAAGIQPNGESVYVFSAGYIVSHLPQTFKLLANTLGRGAAHLPSGLVGALPGEPIVYGLEISWTLTLGLLLVLLACCLRQQAGPRLHGRGRWLLGGVCLGVTALMVLANVSWTPHQQRDRFWDSGAVSAARAAAGAAAAGRVRHRLPETGFLTWAALLQRGAGGGHGAGEPGFICHCVRLQKRRKSAIVIRTGRA